MQSKSTLFLLFFAINFITAQSPTWLNKSESVQTFTSHSFHSSVYLDNNFYWTGDFWKDICFDEECIELAAGSDVANAFLLKTDSEGNTEAVWHFASTDYVRIQDITTNPTAGTLIIVGNYRQNLTFGSFTVESLGSTESFVMEISTAGELLWMQRIEALNEGSFSIGRAVDIDSEGNIYSGHVTGGTVKVGDFEHTNEGEVIASLIVKMDNEGNVLNTQNWVGEGFEFFVEVNEIKVLANDNIVIGGDFIGSFDYADQYLEGSTGAIFGFLIAEDSDLTPLWNRKFTGTASGINDILVDGNQLLTSISYNSFVNINGETFNGTGSWRETVMALLDENGNTVWAENFTLSEFSGNKSVSVRDAVKSNGKYWLGGLYQNYVKHDEEIILSNQYMEGSSFQFPLLMALNTDGDVIETHNFTGSQTPALITVLAGNDEQVSFGGEFFSNLQLEDFSLNTVNSTLFYGSLGETINDTYFIPTPNPCDKTLTYTIDNQYIKLKNDNLSSARLYDVSGQLIQYFNNPPAELQFPISDLSAGMYLLEVVCEAERRVFKILVR